MLKIKQKIFRFLLLGAFLLILLIIPSGFKKYTDTSEYLPDSSKNSNHENIEKTLSVEEQPDSVRYKKDENGVYYVVPDMPQFPGGIDSLLIYLRKKADAVCYNSKSYHCETDRVICQFIINEDGSISNINILKSRTGIYDKEVIRIIEEMPNWEPGIYEEKPVKCKYALPINFKMH